MRSGLTNLTHEERKERNGSLEKRRTCTTCGAERDQALQMLGFEQTIIQHLRHSRIVKRDSCIQCVEKHIGLAIVLYGELLKATDTNNVNAPLNHLQVIGNLQAAADEAEKWQELWAAIDSAERDYRYRGIGPNWSELAKMIADVKAVEPTVKENPAQQ